MADISKILKFLFPEYQIIESIKTYGFIAKKRATSPTSSSFPQSVAVKEPAGQKVDSQRSLSRRPALKKANSNQANPNPANSIPNPSLANPNPAGDTAEYLGNTNLTFSRDQIDAHQEKAKTSVQKRFVGQKKAIDELFLAFKRPHVAGVQKDKPQNTLFVIGSESIGKNTLIATAVSALKEAKLLNYPAATQVDLALYPTQAERPLFLSDLYKALYASSEVIVFENFEKCHPGNLGLIADLVISGKHQLGARYAMQNNDLIEATGVLMQNSISEISANNKYFVFPTHLSENKVADLWGSKFMENVADIIQFTPYTQSEITEITKGMLLRLSSLGKNHLSLVINYSEEFVQQCVSKYTTGLKAVEDFIMKDVYKALSEYKLRNTVPTNAQVHLDSLNDKIYGVIKERSEETRVDLTLFLPKKNTSNIDEIKKELAEVVGLAKVKEYVLGLENNLKVQQLREAAGYQTASISMHMVFTGNPGTGKTTIARIVAKYLKAIGVLSTGQLREVSRGDLVGQYLGHTAKQTNEVIQSALGGVLFIDEAYSLCRDKNDPFGLEAIDTLVKAIEDHRDDLVVILAGYKEEMESFFQVNSGLKSRFPNIIEFEDYSAPEMVQIADLTAKAKGYKIAADSKEALLRLFEKSQIKGRK